MPKAHATTDVWAVKGRFKQLVYSPRGGIEGVLIDTRGITTQFVLDPNDAQTAQPFTTLADGQALEIEGAEVGPSPKGHAEHTVYHFERLVSVDGRRHHPVPDSAGTRGTVVRFNYARHGEANGVVLDNGDFVHTKPDGFVRLGLAIGDAVDAEGPSHPLVTGKGRVVEAERVNGSPV